MAVASKVLNESVYHLGNQDIKVKSIMPIKEPNFKESMHFKAISPISVHKTINIKAKKKTVYFSPFEKEFENSVKNNLIRKYEAFTQKKLSKENFSIIPATVESKDSKIFIYEKDKQRPFVIKGWTGIYKIEGESELIKFAYRSGLGARNSQGFGFVKVVE